MRKILPMIFAGVLVAAGPEAEAQWYGGIGVGASKGRLDAGSQSDQLGDLGFLDPISSSTDKTDTAFRVYGGWRLHRNVAVELGYANLGRFELTSSVQPAGTLRASVETNGVDLSIVGMLPFDRWSVFARAGAFMSRTETLYVGTGSVAVIAGQQDQTKSSTGWVWGAGATFAVTPQLGLRLEYARYDRLGDDITGKFSANSITAGIQWRF